MKAAFPYMGNIHIPLSGLFRALGGEPVIPPPPSKETIAQGVLLAPEQMCIPFKYTLGNMVRALELGADTLVYVGGSWSCRYGYYARLQPDILHDLGYRFKTIVLRHDEYPVLLREAYALCDRNPAKLAVRAGRAVRIFWLKSSLIDSVERRSRRLRPQELEPGSTTRLYKSWLSRIDAEDSPARLTNSGARSRNRFRRSRPMTSAGRCA